IRPALLRKSQCSSPSSPAGGRATEPSGLVSVIPQAWMIRSPCFCSQACISDSGTAAPPQMTRSTLDRSGECCSAYFRRSAQIVGTAALIVTFSASIALASGSACMNLLGITRLQPVRPAAYGMPQALAWNIGTIGSIRSDDDSAIVSAVHAPNECSTFDLCE